MISNIIIYVKTYEKFCRMVDSALKLNIDASIYERKWSPDEFHYLLSKYTDQVS